MLKKKTPTQWAERNLRSTLRKEAEASFKGSFDIDYIEDMFDVDGAENWLLRQLVAAVLEGTAVSTMRAEVLARMYPG